MRELVAKNAFFINENCNRKLILQLHQFKQLILSVKSCCERSLELIGRGRLYEKPSLE